MVTKEEWMALAPSVTYPLYETMTGEIAQLHTEVARLRQVVNDYAQHNIHRAADSQRAEFLLAEVETSLKLLKEEQQRTLQALEKMQNDGEQTKTEVLELQFRMNADTTDRPTQRAW